MCLDKCFKYKIVERILARGVSLPKGCWDELKKKKELWIPYVYMYTLNQYRRENRYKKLRLFGSNLKEANIPRGKVRLAVKNSVFGTV